MSIASQIQDYKYGLMDAYDAVNQRGGTMPARCNMDSLATAINSIPSSGTGVTPEEFFRTVPNPLTHANSLTRLDVTNSQAYTANESIKFPCDSIGYAAYAWMFGFPYFEQLPTNEKIYNTSLKTLTIGGSDNTAAIESGNYAFMGAFSSCSGLNNVTIYLSAIVNSNQVFLYSFTGGSSENQSQSEWKDLVISFPKLKTIAGGSKIFTRMFYPRACYRTVTVDFSGLTQQPQNVQEPFVNMFQQLQLSYTGPQTVTLRVPYNLRTYFQNQVPSMSCGYNINIVGV